jgi:hypothetical protein
MYTVVKGYFNKSSASPNFILKLKAFEINYALFCIYLWKIPVYIEGYFVFLGHNLSNYRP